MEIKEAIKTIKAYCTGTTCKKCDFYDCKSDTCALVLSPEQWEPEWATCDERRLLPCPLCGHVAGIFPLDINQKKETARRRYVIGCADCGLRSSAFDVWVRMDDEGNVICFGAEKSRAIDKWNRRAQE